MMQASPDVLRAVAGRDRIEVSAELLTAAFGDIADQPLPSALLDDIVQLFAHRHTLPGKYRRVIAGLPKRDPEATVFRLVLDVLSSWSAAGLATPVASSGDDGNTRLILTLRGSAVLRSGRALAQVQEMLEEAGSSRSFVR
jgi:hypothetical protein